MKILANQAIVTILLLLFHICTAHAQTIVPTQTDEIIIDNGTSGKADPGDRIRYKVTIQNTGSPAGTGVQLNVVPDPRTTFVAGTFKSSPLALPDAYTCTGNVPIFVAAPGVKGNDFDEGAPASLSISTATNQATLRGGSVDIFADGSFEYTPPAGYEGDDSFTYTLNDATQAGPGAPITDVGTVTITISGMIWFINNTAAAGDGRLSSPFNSLGAFNTANGGMTMNNGDVVNPEINETIFLYTGGSNYTGGITLLDGQRLFGQGASTANLSILTGITFNPNSLTLPTAGGTDPVVTNAAGDGILLGSGNTVRGLNIGVCSDFGIDDNGTVGTLTISEVDINTTGSGFRTDNGGTLAVALGPMTTTGGVNGINLGSTGGSFSAGVVSITNPSGTGINVQSASTAINLGTTTVSKSGAGTGVSLASSSSNVTFSSLGINTSNGSALVGTEHTGSITVTNNTGSLSATAGAAIDLTRTTGNTAIDLKFNAVTTVNTPAYGIRLDNVGGTGLTISGATNLGMAVGSTNGILMENVSAGTYNISTAGVVNVTSRRNNGIVMSGVTNSSVAFGNTTIPNANSVTVPAIRSTSCSGSTSFAQANVNMNNAGGFESFTNISTPGDNSGDGDAIYITGFTGTGFAINGGTIENVGDDGIDIRNSSNLTLSNVIIEDCGINPAIQATIDHNSSCVQALNLTGTNNITGSTFQRGGLRNFYITQTSGNTTLNIGSTCVFDDTRTSGSTKATDNLQVYLDGSAIASIDIENSSFLRSRTDQISVILLGSSQLTKLDITGITMDYQSGVSGGIRLDCGGASTANFNIMNNTKLYSQDENVVTISATGTAQVQGRIKGNLNMKYNGSSSGGSIFSGIRVLSDGTTSVATVLIENNVLEIVNCDFGINLAAQGANSPIVNATVNSNTITATGVTHLEGIVATVNNIVATGKLICLTVNNNNVSGAALARVCRLRVLGITGVRVTNYDTNLATTWTNNGNMGSPVAESTSGGGTIAAAPVACVVPTNPLP
ncbi:MAG: hypothetical protein IT262_06620 [Saprospiraceae bacterium]|nr:hypothetical protein [Saprospiraceae bacterium]